MGEIDRLYQAEKARADELDDRVVKLTDAAVRNAHTIERRGALITQLRDQAAVDTAALARWRALADSLAADFASLRASMGFDEDNESLARYREATQQ